VLYRIFLSHSHKDSALALELANSLKPKRDFKVFRANYDPALVNDIPEKILKKIIESDLIIVMWSKNSSKSNWVNQEIGMALGSKREVLPIVLGRGLVLPDTLKRAEKKGQVITLPGRKQTALNAIKDIIYKKASKKNAVQEAADRKAKTREPIFDEPIYEPDWRADQDSRLAYEFDEFEREQYEKSKRKRRTGNIAT